MGLKNMEIQGVSQKLWLFKVIDDVLVVSKEWK